MSRMEEGSLYPGSKFDKPWQSSSPGDSWLSRNVSLLWADIHGPFKSVSKLYPLVWWHLEAGLREITGFRVGPSGQDQRPREERLPSAVCLAAPCEGGREKAPAARRRRAPQNCPAGA